MLKMTTYPYTLSITVTTKLLHPSKVMLWPWRKSNNQINFYYPPTLPQNQLVNRLYPNDLFTVTCPINVNGCITSFSKNLVSLDLVLLISPVFPLWNTILILATLNPSNKERTAPATIIVKRSKSRGRRCYRTALSSLVLVFRPAQ